MKKVGKIVKTVVEVQMLRQDKAAQRLDGIDKTWALERLEHVSLVQLELKKIDARSKTTSVCIRSLPPLSVCQVSTTCLTGLNHLCQVKNT